MEIILWTRWNRRHARYRLPKRLQREVFVEQPRNDPLPDERPYLAASRRLTAA